MPLEDRPRSCWIVGAAIETIVWSIKVMATAKIIAVRIRLRDWPPPVLLLIVPSLVVAPLADSQPVRCPAASRQLSTWVAAVGLDNYVATVTPAEQLAGGRPLQLSLTEDGVALAQPRLVTDGDVKG